MTDIKEVLNYFNGEDDPEEVEKPKLKETRILSDKEKAYYNKIINNIKVSERLRSEINLDIKAGKEPKEILDKALRCISLMVDDKTFYNNNTLN